ncbi:MAG: cell division protein FtsQ/DivIB [Patescibacteria group bacterium]|nr:cell division protein FtsQ/DivIB [Patescibacteria group bacterium]
MNPDVASEIEKLRGKNIFTVVLSNTEVDLAKKQNSIESISIRRGVPDTLKIKVFVRNPLIGWKSQDKIYLIDKNGVVFERGEGIINDEEFAKLPVVNDTQNAKVSAGSQQVSPDLVNFVKYLADNFNAKTSANITELKIGETTLQLEARTDQGWFVLLDTLRSPEVQLNALKKLLSDNRDDIHEYVDLRVEGKAYLK